MLRPLSLLLFLLFSAVGVSAETDLFDMRGITLEDAAFSAIRREMQKGEASSALSVEIKAWRAAMRADSDEGLAARLLPLLMKLNPELSPEKYPELYTAVLQLHVRARRGEAAAVAELAAALRCGMWKELALPTDSESAETGETKGTF